MGIETYSQVFAGPEQLPIKDIPEELPDIPLSVTVLQDCRLPNLPTDDQFIEAALLDLLLRGNVHILRSVVYVSRFDKKFKQSDSTYLLALSDRTRPSQVRGWLEQSFVEIIGASPYPPTIVEVILNLYRSHKANRQGQLRQNVMDNVSYLGLGKIKFSLSGIAFENVSTIDQFTTQRVLAYRLIEKVVDQPYHFLTDLRTQIKKGIRLRPVDFDPT